MSRRFNTIKFETPIIMPDGHKNEFDYQSTDFEGYDFYKILSDGKLVLAAVANDDGTISHKNQHVFFTGEINIYTGGLREWHDYNLVFDNGVLKEIVCNQTNIKQKF